MSLPNLDPNVSPETLVADIRDYVAKADALLNARDAMNLTGLDTAIESLCQRILQLTPEESKKYLPELEALMESVTALQAKMEALQTEVKATINSLGNQRKATKAYNNAPSSTSSES